MKDVIERVDQEYKILISNQKQKIQNFQKSHKKEISSLYKTAENTNQDDYMLVLNDFKKLSSQIKLFSIIDSNQKDVFEKITGDFLPDCKRGNIRCF
jgi:basic membrane lipoprotein Med (substrate-binding protein (PBP1-ABC) superfamily)